MFVFCVGWVMIVYWQYSDFMFVGLYYLYTGSRFHLLESPSFPYIALEILNLF